MIRVRVVTCMFGWPMGETSYKLVNKEEWLSVLYLSTV